MGQKVKMEDVFFNTTYNKNTIFSSEGAHHFNLDMKVIHKKTSNYLFFECRQEATSINWQKRL